jgi:hypothetical protein
MMMTDDWIDEFLRAAAERAALKERGILTSPVKFRLNENGEMERVGDDE